MTNPSPLPPQQDMIAAGMRAAVKAISDAYGCHRTELRPCMTASDFAHATITDELNENELLVTIYWEREATGAEVKSYRLELAINTLALTYACPRCTMQPGNYCRNDPFDATTEVRECHGERRDLVCGIQHGDAQGFEPAKESFDEAVAEALGL